VRVVLPDGAELELPDGASGLDAARAIGPKLAEQAVLVRVNGVAQDLRLPLTDRAAVQILTTRDRQDADALWVLRHSTAHLLAEAVRVISVGAENAWRGASLRAAYYVRGACEVSLADCVLLASAGKDDTIATADPSIAFVARKLAVELVPLPDSAGRRP
jgi:hypothetical protein